MHAHVYHEGVGKKGANNVVSLIMKTLIDNKIIREDEIGGELNIVFDNCSGQNKNNTVLKLASYLTEMRYFKKVNFIFLVVGHTKNAADRLFNALKMEYHDKNIFTMGEMINVLNKSNSVTVHPSAESDFLTYDIFFGLFYSAYTKKVKQNHIFTADSNNKVGNQIQVDLRQSDLPEHQVVKHNAIKRGFHGRKQYATLPAAMANRRAIMTAAKDEYLQPIIATGINPYKQVEMYTKYRPIVPHIHHCDDLYARPDPAIIQTVCDEEKKRKHL